MINNHFPTVFGVLVVLAALAAPANAAERPRRHISLRGRRWPRREIPLRPRPSSAPSCWFATHATATNGVPRNAATPIIWGLQENYLLKQLHDFQSGDRDNEVMTWMATALSQAELGPAAAYFAKKNWPARSAGAASTSPPAGVAVCQICHQQNFVGGLPAPRLAGQTLRISGRGDAPLCRR